MKTKYKHIYFREVSHLYRKDRKTKVWDCLNIQSDTLLAIIKWYPSWRQYCFFVEEGTVFSRGCLEDVLDFLKQIRGTRKSK